MAPWVDRIAAGEPNVLTREPVLALERTSGTGGAVKLIPYTSSLRKEFGAAVDAWIHDMHVTRPLLLGKRSYWSVSPVAQGKTRTAGGVRIGLEDDTQYFHPLIRLVLRRTLAVPPEVARISDIGAWQRETCRRLLACEDLGFISVWSPTFLVRLMEEMQKLLPALLPELPSERRFMMEARLDAAGRITLEALWPSLALLSCWTEGFAAKFLPELRAFAPTVEVQPKGLLATEGVVTIPWSAAGGAIPALTSHFIELLDLEVSGEARLIPVYEARVGGRYQPVISTSGGLLRYRLGDALRCTGRYGEVPVLAFEGRVDRVVDLVGEKLSEDVVEPIVEKLLAAHGLAGRFSMLVPELLSPPRYALWVDLDGSVDPAELAADLDRALFGGVHYRYARDLGQLGAPVVVRASRQDWEQALLRQGKRLGDLKPSILSRVPLEAGRC